MMGLPASQPATCEVISNIHLAVTIQYWGVTDRRMYRILKQHSLHYAVNIGSELSEICTFRKTDLVSCSSFVSGPLWMQS